MRHLIKIAITGKIASGKSTISKIIKKLGFPVFESDKEVNKLFREQAVKIKIKELFDRFGSSRCRGSINVCYSSNSVGGREAIFSNSK